MVTVTFRMIDWILIGDVALKRHYKYRNTPSNYGTNRDIEKDVAGAAGEYAVAEHLGLMWSGAYDDGKADVGTLEVRTRLNHGGRLCIHDREIERKNPDPTTKYVLCWWDCHDETITIVGWAFASEIRQANIYHDGRHYIPNDRLHDIETVLL